MVVEPVVLMILALSPHLLLCVLIWLQRPLGRWKTGKCIPHLNCYQCLPRLIYGFLWKRPSNASCPPRACTHGVQLWRNAIKIDLDCENVEARNVSINGYGLTLRQIRWWAVQHDVRFRSDTHYWYDHQSGFLGKLGGPVKWVVDPLIPVHGSLHPRSSLGETNIFVNKREIPA